MQEAEHAKFRPEVKLDLHLLKKSRPAIEGQLVALLGHASHADRVNHS